MEVICLSSFLVGKCKCKMQIIKYKFQSANPKVKSANCKLENAKCKSKNELHMTNWKMKLYIQFKQFINVKF